MSTAKAKIVSRNVAPTFTHDCDACRFLGSLDGVDLYHCPNGAFVMYGDLVRRFSSEPSDYGSIPAVIAGQCHNGDGSPYSLALVLALRPDGPRNAYMTEASRPSVAASRARMAQGEVFGGTVCKGCEDCDGEGGHSVRPVRNAGIARAIDRKLAADDYSNSLTYSATERAPFAPPVSRRRRA